MRTTITRRINLPKPQIKTAQRFIASSSQVTLRKSTPYICQSCRNSLRQRPALTSSISRHQSTSASSTSHATESPFQSQRQPQTHYDFFPETLPSGPPPAGPFDIDIRALRKEFLQLQAKAHPDRHSAENKLRAEATSARINEAYKTLQSPLLRAQYCLSLQGIDVAEDETAKVQDPELLMSVMEIREAVEEAESEEDLVELKRENDERIEESVRFIGEGFGRGDVEGVKAETIRLRYWVNVKESLDGWEKGKGVVLEH